LWPAPTGAEVERLFQKLVETTLGLCEGFLGFFTCKENA
jgi:hypothetical protein